MYVELVWWRREEEKMYTMGSLPALLPVFARVPSPRASHAHTWLINCYHSNTTQGNSRSPNKYDKHGSLGKLSLISTELSFFSKRSCHY